MIEIYGIPNCDTMRKARKWLDAHGIAYRFRNYKTAGVDPERLSDWVGRLGWEALLNRRGTTWRKLPESERVDIDRDRAIQLMCEYPSMIRRPLLVRGDTIEVGFSEDAYARLLV
jgi:arsenate reductase